MNPLSILVFVVVLFHVEVGYGCETGWASFGSMCYKASIDVEDWTGAYTMCKSMKADLAEITSVELDMFLAGLGNDSITVGYWVGMTDVEIEGTWVWIKSKTPLAAGSYTNWGQNQPDNGIHDENCAFLNDRDNGLWYDGHCNDKRDYICEKADVSAATAVVG